MATQIELMDIKKLAANIDAEIRALPMQNTPSTRTARRKYLHKLKQTGAKFVLDLAKELIVKYRHRWFAYELIQNHKSAFQCIAVCCLQHKFQTGFNF